MKIAELEEKGEALLGIEDQAEALVQFDNWVVEVAKWLQAIAPESDLVQEWEMQGGSNLVTGAGSKDVESNWWRFRMAVNKRLFWLSRLPTGHGRPSSGKPGRNQSVKQQGKEVKSVGMQTAGVIDYIVNWLNTYCDTAGMHGFVVGVSGGIDSAVTATLCAKTGKPVMLLNMPIYQAAEQISLADQHIKWLEQNYKGAGGVHIDLTQVFQAFENTLPREIQEGLTMANTRSRVRMIALYAFAAHHRMLVAGTGNKVEDFGVGFFTKYGDGGVDISPIADLLKSEVYEIGKELGIINTILDTPPTDGLWFDNRTDEGQIGATYAELEWAMQFEADSGNEDKLPARKKEVLDIYRNFHNANRHKMIPVPVCKIPVQLK